MMSTKQVVKNASWIIGCKIAQSVLGLIVSMLTARYLGPSNFGLINYAASLATFILPVMQLGLSSTVVQEIINAPDSEGEIIGTTIGMSFASACACIVGLFSFVSFVNAGETETIIVCLLYSLQLLFQSIEIIQYWYQAKLKSKYTSLAMVASYTIVSLYKIYLLVSGKSVYWFAVSHSIDFAIISIVLLFIYSRIGTQKLRFSFKLARKLFSRSKYYVLSGLMVSIFSQTDRVMLKVMMDDAATGFYSAAVQCSTLTNFVFTAILDSGRPLIFDSKKNDEQKYKEHLSSMYAIVIFLSLIQCVIISVFAKYIIRILYGAAYLQASAILRIVVWYTAFAYLGSVRNIWLLAENKQKYLLFINLSGAIANVIMNAILIPISGAAGAAIASLITQIFANIIISIIFKPIQGVNQYLLAGCNPKRIRVMLDVVLRKFRK